MKNKKEMKTIAQMLNVKEFPFTIKDSKGRDIYEEFSDGTAWFRWEYDSEDRNIYHENYIGWWTKREYDKNGNLVYNASANGDWRKNKYDSNNNLITSEGVSWRGGHLQGWCKEVFDSNGNVVYLEHEDGYWYKKEYDSEGNEIYFENSNGRIEDNRNN